jgi:hypothetical protein
MPITAAMLAALATLLLPRPARRSSKRAADELETCNG